MEFLEQVPNWVGEASSEVLVFLAFIAMIMFYIRAVFPLQRELNADRRKVAEDSQRAAAEQRDFYENKVIPTLQGLADSLKNALEIQRVQYEGKLAALENERNVEREKLIKNIAELNMQIKTLTERISKLEEESRHKDDEIAELKKRLVDAEAARDRLQAELDALKIADSARHSEKPVDAPSQEKAA